MSLPARLIRSKGHPGNFTLFSPSEPSRHLFDEMPQRDLRSLNSLLATHLRNHHPLTTWTLFTRIHRGRSDLDPYTFTPVLGACLVSPTSFHGRLVHALMIKFGSDTQVVPQTALMDMYSKHGLMAESSKVFAEMGSKDLVTWNAMISNFVRNAMAEKALLVFDEMRRNGVGFSGFTLCSVLKACTSLNALRQGMQVHGLIVTMGNDLVVLGTALIDFYSHFGMIDRVFSVYGSLESYKDSVMRNSFIAACVRNRKYGDALLVLSSMKPNLFALTSALAACSEKSDLWVGKQIHCVALRFGLFSDTQLCNALLDMYGKSGEVSLARSVFDRMPKRNVLSWTSIIDVYGANGNGIAAVELFKKMEEAESNVSPNDVTILAVLSACSHSGLVEHGRKFFHSAQRNYRFSLKSKHYACYIDMLGKAGLVEEMWCVYEDMVKNGAEVNGEIWAALLNCCVQSKDVSRGEFAARRLFELEPDKAGMRVMLSNFYAAVGKWDSAEQLRSSMKGKTLFKNAGISWMSSHTEPMLFGKSLG